MAFKIFSKEFRSSIYVAAEAKCDVPALLESLRDLREYIIAGKTSIRTIGSKSKNGFYLTIFPQSMPPIRFKFQEFQAIYLSKEDIVDLKRKIVGKVNVFFNIGSSDIVDGDDCTYKYFRDISIKKIGSDKFNHVEFDYFANRYFCTHTLISRFYYKEEDLVFKDESDGALNYYLKEGYVTFTEGVVF